MPVIADLYSWQGLSGSSNEIPHQAYNEGDLMLCIATFDHQQNSCGPDGLSPDGAVITSAFANSGFSGEIEDVCGFYMYWIAEANQARQDYPSGVAFTRGRNGTAYGIMLRFAAGTFRANNPIDAVAIYADGGGAPGNDNLLHHPAVNASQGLQSGGTLIRFGAWDDGGTVTIESGYTEISLTGDKNDIAPGSGSPLTSNQITSAEIAAHFSTRDAAVTAGESIAESIWTRTGGSEGTTGCSIIVSNAAGPPVVIRPDPIPDPNNQSTGLDGPDQVGEPFGMPEGRKMHWSLTGTVSAGNIVIQIRYSPGDTWRDYISTNAVTQQLVSVPVDCELRITSDSSFSGGANNSFRRSKKARQR